MTAENTLCPCGSMQKFFECCEPYLTHQKFPETPEALMRSRYTAYSLANIEYIVETMREKALVNFNPKEAWQWASQVKWLDLKVISAISTHTDIGFVEFIASFTQSDQRHIIHERSEFHKIAERWYYVCGTTPKIYRNNPCPCGSRKKSKHCCFS